MSIVATVAHLGYCGALVRTVAQKLMETESKQFTLGVIRVAVSGLGEATCVLAKVVVAYISTGSILPVEI